MHLSAEFRQRLFVDARLDHVGIRHDVGAVSDGFQRARHCALGKHQIVRIVKIRRGVNDALDNQANFLRKYAVTQFFCDNRKAALFDVRRFDNFKIHLSPYLSIPRRAVMPLSYGCRIFFISVI